MGVIVGRYINGVGLNGLEYLLDPVGNEMVFESEEAARIYLIANGYSDEDIESLVFEEW